MRLPERLPRRSDRGGGQIPADYLVYAMAKAASESIRSLWRMRARRYGSYFGAE